MAEIHPSPKIIRLFRKNLKSTYQDWFRTQTLEVQASCIRRIQNLENGHAGDNHDVTCSEHGNEVFELVFKNGVRVYLADEGTSVMLLLGGNKNTQQRDIAMACKYWTEYKRRVDAKIARGGV